MSHTKHLPSSLQWHQLQMITNELCSHIIFDDCKDWKTWNDFANF